MNLDSSKNWKLKKSSCFL